MKKSSKLDIFVTSLLLETKTQKHNYMINNTLDANFQIYTYLYLFPRFQPRRTARIRTRDPARQFGSAKCK